MQRRLLLAFIGQAIAPAAGKKLASAIKDGRSPSAIATIAIDRTDKPRAYTTEVASRQSDRHSLLIDFQSSEPE